MALRNLISSKLLVLFPMLVACKMGDASQTTATPDPSVAPAATDAAVITTASRPLAVPAVGTDTDRYRVAEGEQAFATRLHAQLPREGNVFFSPTSVRMALAMTFAGAKGETATQMEKALALQGSAQTIHDGFAKELQDLAQANGAKQTVRVVNQLWAQKGRPFDAGYLSLLQRNYAAPLVQLDFRADGDQSRRTINTFIEDRTEHRIKDLIALPLPEDTKLVLTNAVYFKATWRDAFQESSTADAPFFVSPSKTTQARLMSATHQLRYGKTADAQVLELPYASGDMAMMIVLPNGRNGLAKVEQSMNDASIASWAKSLSSTQVDVKLPKFTMTSTFSLAEKLGALGMPGAFDAAKADFSGMDGTKELFLGDVVHKAFVAVDETGTEAAAATAVAVRAGAAVAPSPPVDFRADHPFVFFIRDTRGTVLFMGRVADPTAAP